MDEVMWDFLRQWIRRGRPAPDTTDRIAPGAKRVAGELVVIEACGQNPEETRRLLGQVTELAIEHGAEVRLPRSDIVMAVFESRDGRHGGGRAALDFKTGLFERHAQNVKALYGLVRTVKGCFGNERQMVAGYIFPGLNEAFEQLDAMSAGQCRAHEFPDWFGDARNPDD